MPDSMRLCLLALTVGCITVATHVDPVLAQKRHPAETAGIRSGNGQLSTSIQFVNRRSTVVKTYWLNYEGQRVFYKSLRPGQQYVQPTYLTHPWLVTDANDNALYVFFPDAQPRTAEIR